MNYQIALYVASLLGAVALVLMMPKSRGNFRVVGGLLGAATLGGLWIYLGQLLTDSAVDAMGWGQWVYYYIFSAIAIVAAVRVITHTRPVYAALWFVLVILSSSGLFLTLSAEFMAFAMVIIYAGAILVTYLFVLMLAVQSQPDDAREVHADYDACSREPLAACAAGFLLLAMLLSWYFDAGVRPGFNPAFATDREQVAAMLADRPAPAPEGAFVLDAAVEPPVRGGEVSNTQDVGLDLFISHPLGLELAGVILLVALIGAVVIARTRLDEEGTGPVGDPSGASPRPRRESGPHDMQTYGQSGGRLNV
ncbi:MAG: NADH-quinone oxidoreductase subunit J [Phycisphaeraceae bacterium]